MARYKPQEVVRRQAIPARHAEVPVLAVHADQEPSRYSGSLARVAGGGIQMLGDIYARRRAQRQAGDAEADVERGSTARRKEELLGGEDTFRSHILEVASEHYKRGYYKTDAMLKIRTWSAETAARLAQAEPDADYATLVQASRTGLLQHPAFHDPHTRQEMLYLLDKADDRLYTQHLQGASREMLMRQEEAMSALIRDRIDSGEPLSNELFDRLYGLLDQEDYGYLSKRSVDDLISSQLVESLAAGREDYPQIVEFLDTRKDENGISLLDGAHGQRLRAAVVAGRQQLDARAKDARDAAYADAYFELDGEARRGLLTRERITQWAERLGVDGSARRAFYQQWNNRQRQTEERWAREAVARRQDAIARELYEFNPRGLPESTIRKILDDKWSRAGEDEQARSAVIDEAIAKGVVPSFIQNFLQRGGYGDVDFSRRQNALYQDLRTRDPGFAAKAAGNRAVFYDILQDDVEIGGHSPDALHARMGATKRTREEAEHIINRAWTDLAKEHPELEVNGETYPLEALDQFRIKRRALEIATEHPGVTAGEAWKAARRDAEVRQTIVNGKRVLRDKLPPGGEAAVEALLESVAQRSGVALDTLAAHPAPGTGREWLVTDMAGFPFADPETGGLLVFGTDELMGHYTVWHGSREVAKAYSGQRAHQISRLRSEERLLQLQLATGRGLPHDALGRLQAVQDELGVLLASPDPASDRTERERRLAQLKAERGLPVLYPQVPDVERLRALDGEIAELESTGSVAGIPDDFYTYLHSVKGQ